MNTSKLSSTSVNNLSVIVYRSFLTVPSGAPFVSLDSSPDSVRGGDTLNVSCTVLGEPEVDVTFTWSYPGQVRVRLLGSKLKVKHDSNVFCHQE